MGAKVQSVKSSFLENVKNFDLGAIVQNIKDMNFNWIEMATFMVAGIVIGFICNRYCKSILFSLFIIVAAIIIFEYFGFITIKWECIQSMLGSSPMQTVDAFCRSAYIILRSNISLMISFVVGFLIGIKVG